MPSPQKTLTDYLVIAITPALIMTLIGSLTFFLITVFYDGPFEGRLHFICAMFIMATVSIGRISMEEGTEYAVMYSIPLGLVAIVAVTYLVEIQSETLREISGIINVGLLAIIWWSAHKLTWDCTWIHEHVDAGGEGLLGNLGVDNAQLVDDGNDVGQGAEAAEERSLSWWQRFSKRRRRPHAPGLWVIYFSLAALPLFGFGQWFLRDRRDAEQLHRYAFMLLCVYVISALGLLLTTSFLGLRRYLRQRKVEMPLEMATSWLCIGVGLIVAMLVFCLLLPRPGVESPFSELAQVFKSSDDLKTSRQGMGKDGIDGEEPGSGKNDNPNGDGDGDGTQDNDRGAGQSPDPDSDSTQGSSSDQGQSGGSSGKSPQSGGNDQRGKPSSGGSDSQDSKGNDSSSEDGQETAGGNQEQGSTDETASQLKLPDHLPESVLPIIKILFYIAIALVAIYLLIRYRKELMAALRSFIRELQALWDWLRGHRQRKEAGAVESTDQTPARVYRPFASYSNPFTASRAGDWTAEQIVRYSFDALEAWAREMGRARQEHETPNEFTRSLGKQSKQLASSLRRMGRLYSRAAYAPGSLPESCLEDVRGFWQVLPSPILHPAGPATGQDSTAT